VIITHAFFAHFLESCKLLFIDNVLLFDYI
jgi:hypothetical protein